MKLILTILLIIGLIFLLTLPSCYTRPLANKQFGRAAITFPEIGAIFCATNYKPKDSLIKGDSIIKFDTIFVGGEVLIDTVRSLDTIRIIKTVQLPAKVITKTVVRVDTIRIESTAKLEVCNQQRGEALTLANDYRVKYEAADKKARKRKLIMWGLIALIALFLGWKVYGMVKRKK